MTAEMASSDVPPDVPADWPNRAAGRRVRAGGIDWHVQVMGQGPVMLLLHGTGAATHSWRDVMPVLASDFTVVASDLPGHGYTRGRAPGGLSLPAVARATGALLGVLGVTPRIVVGHSAGVAIAVRMVVDGIVAPAGVVGISPALLPFPGIAQKLFPRLAKLLFVNPFAPHIAAQIARQPGAVERFLVRSTGSTIDAAGVRGYARVFGASTHCAGALGMMADWDLVALKAALPAMTVPTLVLHGAGDAAIPVAAVHEAAALLPDARVDVIERLGHLAHEEAPQRFAAMIAEFARAQGVV